MTTPARRPLVKLEDLLLRHGAITPAQLDKAKDEQAKWGGDLGRIFVELGYVKEELLLRATAHQLGIHFVDPAAEHLDPEIVRALAVQLCEQFGVIAVAGDLRKKMLRLATSDPQNAKVLGHITAQTGFHLELCVATGASIQAAIRRHFYGEGLPQRSLGPIDLPPESPDAPSGVLPLAAPVTPPPPEPGGGLAALAARVSRLEDYLGSLQKELSRQISTDPQLVGLAARLEHLEQISANDVGSLRAVVELLLERGTFKLDDLKAKVKLVRERSGSPGSSDST